MTDIAFFDLGVSILAFVVAIGVLVAVHEFGHFWVARRLGFKVLRFSIGFGKPLLRWRGSDPDRVEYWLSAIPLGGYVKMLDEREGPVPAADSHRAFNRRPIPHRILVLLAGPGFNFIFAIVAFWIMFATGVPGIKPLIGAVTEDSVAARAGLQANDVIEAVGGRSTATWEHATLAILDELLADGLLDLVVREPNGTSKNVELDVRGRVGELTEPSALFTGLGIRPGPVMPAVIAGLEPGLAAERAGLAVGDRVLVADGVEIRGWEQFVDFVRQRPGETVQLQVLRDGRELSLPVVIGEADDGERWQVSVGTSGSGGAVGERASKVGRIGASRSTAFEPEVLESLRAEQRYGIFESLPRGIEKTWDMSALTLRMLVRMVMGDVSVKNLSGPITIAEYAGESAQAGWSAFLNLLAVISISLGILNLLPIPVLDGGQVVNQIAEWLKGAPLSERAIILGQQVGVFLLIVLMSFAFYNDLSRILG